MNWVTITGLVVSLATLFVAVIGTVLVWLNHRARKQQDLPKIQLYQTGGAYHFRLETDHRSIGWKVIRVEVVDADCGKKEVLAQNLYGTEQNNQGVTTSSRVSEWRDFCEYLQGAEPWAAIYFHPDCYEASLFFVCETPSKVWWNPRQREKKRVPCKYIKGTHPPGHNDPYFKNLLGSS